MISATGLWELEARTSDGSGNNLANGDWGKAGTPLIRETPARYGEDNAIRPYPVDVNGDAPGTGVSGHNTIIEAIVKTEDVAENTYGTTELSAFYGQFITHEMSNVPAPFGAPPPAGFLGGEPFDPTQDPGNAPGVVRTLATLDENGVRQQVNTITHHLDLSLVYGSSDEVKDLLRSNSTDRVEGAKLLTGANGGLPTLADVQAENPGLSVQQLADALLGGLPPPIGGGDPVQIALGTVAAGDTRAAQTPALGSIQTIWMKEHNYLVDKLAEQYPELTSDQLFETARIINEAEHQHIIYNEYLASIIGKENVPQYEGYDASVDPSVTTEFTTVAFRFGHDQQSETLILVDGNGQIVDTLSLATLFTQTSELLVNTEDGLEQMLRGLTQQKSQEVDGKLVDSLTENLFGAPGLNLAILDNARAADHGIGTLNQVREALGLSTYDSFADLTDDPELQTLLAEHYGHIDNVDPWIGGLLEEKVPGSQLGETFQTLVINQFKAIQSGDRFYYETRLQDFPELLAEIKGTTFADTTMRNSDIEHMHGDAFHVANTMTGSDASENLRGEDKAEFLQADNIIGGGGNDRMSGGLGDDTLWGDAGNDILDAGTGDDFVYAGTGHDRVFGRDGDDNVKAGDGNDRVDLGKGDDWVHGENGNDIISCGDGDDIALGGADADRLSGGNDNDQLFGGAGNDQVRGDRGDDLCYGGDGDDFVWGGDGNDTVNGEGGNDTLWGGRGADIFLFTAGAGSDTIFDFNAGEGDKIDVSDYYDSYADLEAFITQSRFTATIDLGDGESITLVGLRDELSENHFIFQDEAAVTLV